MSEHPTALGRSIHAARMARGLTANEVAERTGIHHRATVLRIESGDISQPKTDTLQRLANVLDLDLGDLLALAGYAQPTGLPAFEPYLRAKHADLPDEAITQLVGHFNLIAEKYRPNNN